MKDTLNESRVFDVEVRFGPRSAVARIDLDDGRYLDVLIPGITRAEALQELDTYRFDQPMLTAIHRVTPQAVMYSLKLAGAGGLNDRWYAVDPVDGFDVDFLVERWWSDEAA